MCSPLTDQLQGGSALMAKIGVAKAMQLAFPGVRFSSEKKSVRST